MLPKFLPTHSGRQKEKNFAGDPQRFFVAKQLTMEKNSLDPVIGIDLGTTYSCVGYWDGRQVQIWENDEGSRITPSCVCFTETDCLVGQPAKMYNRVCIFFID